MRAIAMLALDVRLAIRNVLRQKRRSAVGLIAVASGIVALLLASGFFEWNYDAMRENTIRARIGHLQIMRQGYLQSGVADPFAFLMPATSEVRQRIEADPQVDTVAPRIEFSGLVSVGESTLSFLGEGVDPAREERLSGALRILAGEDLSERDGMGIIVGQGLARDLGAKVGQKVVLLANTSSGGINAVEPHIRGIFATDTEAYDNYAIRLPLPTAQALLRVSGVHTWLVLLRQTRQTDAVLERLEQTLASTQLAVIPWYQTAVADFYNKTVSLFSKQVLVVKLMIAVIIVLSILNTMMTNVRERVAEIGTSMALGDRRSTILRRFAAEGAVLGLLGGVIGAVAGLSLAWLISWVGIPMPAPPGMAHGYVAGILLTPRLVAEAIALSIFTAFLAGLYPAWKASRMSIHDALRHAH